VALDLFATPFLHVAGSDLQATVEVHRDPRRIDHVWINIDVGRTERLILSINTSSKRNLEAGFDPRVRLGLRRQSWQFLPGRGVEQHAGFNYADVEAAANVFYEHQSREALEDFLLLTAREAILVEAWGEPYYRRRKQPGLHQIHSRRASCAVAEDIKNRDGALRFYFRDHTSVLCLFKFCGQP
jgi:hypothetical protein